MTLDYMRIVSTYVVYFFAIGDIMLAMLYATQGDWPRTVYWMSAGMLTGSTVFIR